jgi:hypothetical protein
MIERFVFLAYYTGTVGTRIQGILSQWEQMGVFSYLLPFLLIFSLVFVILSTMKVFQQNRWVNGIIALSVGLMALQFDFVPIFFSEIFPRLGVGLAIMLVILIVGGFFVDPEKTSVTYVLLVVGVIILITILVTTAGNLGWTSAYEWRSHMGEIIFAIVFLAAIGIIVGVSSGKPPEPLKPLIFHPQGKG